MICPMKRHVTAGLVLVGLLGLVGCDPSQPAPTQTVVVVPNDEQLEQAEQEAAWDDCIVDNTPTNDDHSDSWNKAFGEGYCEELLGERPSTR